jgi:hypothetical protein
MNMPSPEAKQGPRVIPIKDENESKSVNDLFESCENMTIAECRALFMRHEEELIAFFKNTNNLIAMYKFGKLTTTRWLALLDVIRPRLSELCGTSEDFSNIIRFCDEKQKKVFLEQVMQKLRTFTKTSEDFERVLPCLQPEQIEGAYAQMRPEFLELAKTGQVSFVRRFPQVSDKLTSEISSQLSSFTKIYNALEAGETHFFSSASEMESLRLLNTEAKDAFNRFAAFYKYAQANPKSRVAEALRLMETNIPEDQLALVIYKSAFRRSAWYARSCVNGCTLFSSTVDKISAIPAEREAMVGTRYWRICQSLKSKPKSRPKPASKAPSQPTSGAKPNRR